MYVYIQSEPNLWTVGYEDAAGKWHSESDHADPGAAARRVAVLNGGPFDLPESVSSDALKAARTRFASPVAALPRDNGGTAFPSSEEQTHGISARDYFAAHAPPMPDDWASYRRTDPPDAEGPEEELRLAAQWAYVWADALIAARKS